MKRNIFLAFLMSFILTMCLGLTSCHSCGNAKDAQVVKDVKTDTTQVDNKVAAINFEHFIAANKQYMYLNYGEEYNWYETEVLLNDFLDEDCDGSYSSIYSIFHVAEDYDDGGGDAVAVLIAMTESGKDTVDVKHGIWIGDFPMEFDNIKVTYKEAFDMIMAVNHPKPHSKHCVLRKPIGPNQINPQYIFGNVHAQIYVDAVTGDIAYSNPAFPPSIKMPLGEWP